jgi:hypothetical protein
MMNLAYLHGSAALLGSAIGGLATVTSAWLIQRRQDRIKRLSRDKLGRQKLYRQFIEEASKLYADALVHDETHVTALVSLYALISSMRVVASPAVVNEAEAVLQMIADTYFAPNRTFPELRDLMKFHAVDVLRAFSQECHADLSKLSSR